MATRLNPDLQPDFPDAPSITAATLVDLLRQRAQAQPNQRAYTFLDDAEAEHTVTFGELDRRARAIGAHLQALGAAGGRVVLLYPPGLDFFAAFCGAVYAGAIAVTVSPPRPNQSTAGLQAIIRDAQTRFVLTTTMIQAFLERYAAQDPNLRALHLLNTDQIADALADNWQEPAIGPDTIAYLQYTSGSTGMPKGVMVSHSNLLHTFALIMGLYELTPDSVHVTWMPTSHNLGLVGTLLALYSGMTTVMLSPMAVLAHPVHWLRAVTRYKGTFGGGPNFGFDLCVKNITAEERGALDLSSWVQAYSGGEPVRKDTLVRFADAFAPCGFQREALNAGYGLAEHTVVVTANSTARMALASLLTVDKAALEAGRVEEACCEARATQVLVGCGPERLGVKLVIADPESLVPSQPGQVGEILIASPCVAQGYWNRPEESEQTFQVYLPNGEGPFLRTGDLGFLHEGELYITGRLKELIIIRGRNLYPQDIEQTAARSHPALMPNGGAAFSVDAGGEEQLVIVHEVNPQAGDAREAVSAIRQAIAEEYEVKVHAVVLVEPGSIPRTASGKIARRPCRVQFLAGQFGKS
ncbi:MAG TPA: fatty acyl-AMP ligase [Anaerolineae bacterium]|nr:fatty acyl-AMP ligase [Anaerolineae bacterium]